MPTPSAAFRHLARIVTRSPHGNRVEFTAVIGGRPVTTGADGLPLAGTYYEQEAEQAMGEHAAIVSQPWINVAREDLPGIPVRGDRLTFDDGVYVVQYALVRGAGVDIAMSPPSAPGRRAS